MNKTNTSLFIFFQILLLACLTAINLLKDTTCLSSLSRFVVPSISLLLVLLIIILFIYREYESRMNLKQFMTIIAHKVKTPLTGIRWTIDILQKSENSSANNDLLGEMQKANERLMEVMNLLIHFARFDKKVDYDLQACSLKEVAETSLSKNSGALNGKNIKVSVIGGDELPLVLVDKPKIQFAVDMIIDNAVKYTNKNGHIDISFVISKRAVTLRVHDDGIGMNYFDRAKVFKHFFRASNARMVDTEGLGLGLYTARKIVTHHNGKMWAESKGVNKGSTFCIELPVKK